MPLDLDIIERIKKDFSAEESELAIDLLAESGETGRIARCVVFAAKGSFELLGQQIEVAKRDYRDAILAGEYDGCFAMQRRDLSVTFLIDSPEKFWICEVACAASSRGYALVSLQSRASTKGPFQYTSDYGEGHAKFHGLEGDFEVEKFDRRWFLYADSKELDRYDLNHPFDDEAKFGDTLLIYLLLKRRPDETLTPSVKSTRQSMLTAKPNTLVGSSKKSWWRYW